MERTLIAALPHHIGQIVALSGYVRDLRKLGKIAFLVVRDHTGLVQAVLDTSEIIQSLEGCYPGTVINLTGLVCDAPQTKYKVEIKECQIEIIHRVTKPHPIDLSKDDIAQDLDGLLENRVWTLRHPRWTQVFQVAAGLEKNIRNYLDTQGCTQINTPKIIGFPTEGGSEVFDFQYFEHTAYLAQSPQFYKQIMTTVFDRVYEIGRAYRAEKSNTSRHMSEILMLDVEIGFLKDFEELIQFVEAFFITVLRKTRSSCEIQLTQLGQTPPLFADHIPRITVDDLHALMYEHTGEDHRGELDLVPAEERRICEYASTHRGSDAVIVFGFPWSDAKFYHHQSLENPQRADRADLLFRGVELATLTRREVRHEVLIQQMQSQGIDPTNPGLIDYLSAFEYGMSDTGGFGFGIARCIQKLCGLGNAKEAELFPRDRNRIRP